MSRPVRRHTPFGRLRELLDASALGVVTLLLLVASFYATWQGMGDFVASKGAQSEVGTGALVVLVVLTLTLAMYVALRETVNPIRWRNIVIAFPLYALLALWSVGFGYGFWWSLIAGEDATEAALTRTLDSVVDAGTELKAEISAAVALVDGAEASSEARAELERTVGGTCGAASPAGNGPRSRARETSRSQIADIGKLARETWLPETTQFLDAFESSDWTETIEGETPEARKQRLVEAGRRANRWATELSAKSQLYGEIIAERLKGSAQFLSVEPTSGSVDFCYDRDLAEQLRSVASALDKSYEITPIPFRFAEGADGVALAVEDLWIGLFSRVGLVERRAGAGLRPDGRSLIALMAAIGVDFALFIFALLRGGKRRDYRDYNDEPPPPATKTIIENDPPVEGGREAKPVLAHKTPIAALPVSLQETEEPTRPVGRPRVETNPEALNIGTSDFGSESQEPEEQQLEDLFGQARFHLQEMHVAGGALEKSEALGRFNEVLRKLKKVGYKSVGMDDREFHPDLHEIVDKEPSDKPANQIVRMVRPRFIGADGQTIRALVIISLGFKGSDD